MDERMDVKDLCKALGVIYDNTKSHSFYLRLALEELWKRAKKTNKLPKAVMAFHKVYQDDSGLMYIPLKT